jgi:hypothetical protein
MSKVRGADVTLYFRDLVMVALASALAVAISKWEKLKERWLGKRGEACGSSCQNIQHGRSCTWS